ncbi:MAG TPA: glycosyltransferase family 4 protein [Lichenihabitans sp.]|jgi:glycosyltransferase involved in cell wall biosynthesis|nr:glycosyltransferase family 4 protein [Lichenihabitans sp.]
MTKIAITYEPEAYSVDTKLLMGRQSAGVGFLRAYAATRPERAWCFARERAGAADFTKALAAFGSPATRTDWIGAHNLPDLAQAELLYRPDPAIAADGWRRLHHASPSAYSLCGITHTSAHHAVMTEIAQMLSAPVEPWDAIICTSEAVRASIHVILEAQADYLTERLGAARLTLPQLPVIPLGVHVDDFVLSDAARVAARAELGLGEETMFLFVGRLSASSKAHPVPMFLGLEACAATAKVTLVQCGWFETEEARRAFEADAEALCPSVRRLYLDGRDPAVRRRAFAAADVFTSLSDSIQETFGLTPIEAMAAGLPVVVSDWDGYKETVRDGIDGFRIPTITMPAGTGQPLATRYDVGLDDYHAYCGIVGQFVAVNVEAVTEAYRRLAADPALRRRMGAAGAARTREIFDWPVVFGQYQALWTALGDMRRTAAEGAAAKPRLRPDRPDPFTMFAGYPTAPLSPTTLLRRRPGATVELAGRRRALATVRFAELFLPGDDLVSAILSRLEDGTGTTFEALRAHLGLHPLAIAPAILWLGKMGLLDLGEAAASPSA